MFKKLITCFRLKQSINRLCSDTVKKRVTVKRRISDEDVTSFAGITGDFNPIHFKNDGNAGLVHGALLNGLVSGVIGTELPGPGTILVSQEMKFPNPCLVGDTVTVNVELLDSRKIAKCRFEIVDSTDKQVLIGSARLRLT